MSEPCAKFLEPLLMGETRSFVPACAYRGSTFFAIRASILRWARRGGIGVLVTADKNGVAVALDGTATL